jgi:hypothetical protein
MAGLVPGSASFAAEYGTAAEAKALLTRAIAEMAADADLALVKFNDPNGEFRDRDLYVFCANVTDGITTAHASPTLVGTDLRMTKDKSGTPFGKQMLDRAVEGSLTEVSYMWPRPGGTEPVKKVSYVTKIGDQVCGVGFYEQ